MLMPSKSGLMALGLVAVMACSTAGAVTRATATISNLKFDLVDLDPSDGNDPSIDWQTPDTSLQLTRDSGQTMTLYPQPGGLPTWAWSFQQSSYYSHSVIDPLPATVSASMAGGSALSDATLTRADTSTSSPESLTSFVYALSSFYLSPHTELRVTATLNTLSEGPGSAGFVEPPWPHADAGVLFSYSGAYAELYLASNSVVQTSTGSSYTPSSYPTDFPIDAYLDSGSQTASLSFRNDAATNAFDYFYTMASVQVIEFALTIPESPTLPMLSTGLAVLALLARRKRWA